MITQTRPAYYDAPRYAEYCGLSTDDKSTISANNADRFYELDTSKQYIYMMRFHLLGLNRHK